MLTIILLVASLSLLQKWPASSCEWPPLPWKAGQANITLSGIATRVIDWFAGTEPTLGARPTQALRVMSASPPR
jgi:hypothetical protein